MRNSIVSEYEELALKSFAYWTGDGAFVAQVNDNPAATLANFDDSSRELLRNICSRLYLPLPAKSTVPELQINTVDLLYRVLADELAINVREFWPESKTFSIILTHDIDRIRHSGQLLLENIRNGQLIQLPMTAVKSLSYVFDRKGDPLSNFLELQKCEERWGIRSSVFVLRERIRWSKLFSGKLQHCLGVYDPVQLKGWLQQMLESGHEIAFHTDFDSYQNEAVFSDNKSYLESILGRAVVGARSHYLNWSRKTIGILASQGLLYDSTMGFSGELGFRAGTSFPYLLIDRNGQRVWEVPFQAMDTAILSLVAKGALSWDGVSQRIREIVSQIEDVQGCFVVVWHQRHFNCRHRKELFHILEESMRLPAEKDPQVHRSTLAEVINWWTTRPSEISSSI